jgi:nicotinate-nucleotide--dimethylbenzimidazole phosphoribosyltransferase
MSQEELQAALGVGERSARKAVHRGAQLLIAGEMGIANTTAAACLICAFTGATPDHVVGRGTGLDDAGLARKRDVVAAALARVGWKVPLTGGGRAQGALQMLGELGGLEIAAIAGFYIEAARCGAPVLLDGFISTAAALAAVAIEPAVLRWMLASHCSAELGHRVALEALGLDPLLDLELRLGEGTGAVLSLPIIRAALTLHGKMATFSEAGISGAVDGS